MAGSDYYMLRVGDFECLLVRDGGGPRTAASYLPSVATAELEAAVRAEGFDPAALDFSITPMLIRAGSQLVLVDTGHGGTLGNLPAHLRENGIVPEEIGLVVITHGHGDHIDGILDAEGGFVYPNAHYAVWRTEWDYWTAEERYDPADPSHSRRVWQALKAHSQRVRLLDARNTEIVPGIRAVPVPGHSVGQMAVELESNGEKLLHAADTVHHPFQLAYPQFAPKFDYDKAQAAETRRAVFERAADDAALFFAYHFSFPGVGRIVREGDRLRWQPLAQG